MPRCTEFFIFILIGCLWTSWICGFGSDIISHCQQKSLKCRTWVQSQKWQNDLSLFPRQPIQYHITQVYAPTTNTKGAEVVWFYEDSQVLIELTPKKICPFHHGRLECKSRKSRDTWSNRQVWPSSTKWSRERLIAFCQGNALEIANAQGNSKHTRPKTQKVTLHMDITRWSTLKWDWLYSLHTKMEKFYTVSKNKTGSWLWLRSWTHYCKIQA